jgi:Copper/zinc superoxide dismutase (SODC)
MQSAFRPLVAAFVVTGSMFWGCGGSDNSGTGGSGGGSGGSVTGGSGGSARGGSGGGTGGSVTGGSGGGQGGSGGGAGGAGGTGGGTGGSGGGARGGSGGGGGTDGGQGGSGGGQGGGTGDARGDTPAGETGAPRMAVAQIMARMPGGTITGTATFVEVATGVQVTYMVSNCPPGEHPTHIHEGTACGTDGMEGMHWGPARGESIPNITCNAGMTGMLVYTRMSNPGNLRWTIGDGTNSDIVGHPVVIHAPAPNETARHGCGVIRLVP